MSTYEEKKEEIVNQILDYKRVLQMDELFSLRRGVMACEMTVKENELELDYYKVHMTGMAADKRFPGINPKLLELNIKKREIQLEIAKEELSDMKKKLEEKLAKKPE